MPILPRFFRLFTARQNIVQAPIVSYVSGQAKRNFADTPKSDVSSNQVVVQGPESELRVRVRRARAGDTARVLRYVQQQARAAWPGPAPPRHNDLLLLCDYVARALAQGHSMLAEQQEARRGWSQLSGLALGISVCPWDAGLLQQCARCVEGRSRALLHFTAHCLRAPTLHDKYRVHNILQVILIVPKDNPKNAEIVQLLAKNIIQRGRDVGYPLLRFDVTDNTIAKLLEELQLKKEWHFAYDGLPEILKSHENLDKVAMKDAPSKSNEPQAEQSKPKTTPEGNFISVYTAFTKPEKQ